MFGADALGEAAVRVSPELRRPSMTKRGRSRRVSGDEGGEPREADTRMAMDSK
jgi:hypothetical protein